MTQSNGDGPAPQESDTAVRFRSGRRSDAQADSISEHALDDTTAARKRLPAFSYSSRVTPSGSRIDKMNVKIELGTLTTKDEGDIQNLRRNLCFAGMGRMFHRLPYLGESNTAGLPTRKSVTMVDEAEIGQPLLSGELFLKPVDFSQSAGGYIASYRGQLNPTRAIRYRCEDYTTNFENFDELSEHGFFKPVSHTDSLPPCLDGRDNIISGSISDQTYARAEAAYLGGVSHAIADEIRRQNIEEVGAELALTVSQHSLDGCEIYWDFHRRDARGFLEELDPSLKLFAQRWRKRNHPSETHAVDEEGEKEAFSIRLFLNNAVSIQIYAKCRDRLRFEVSFKNPERYIERKTFPAFSIFHEKLGELKAEASSLLNELLLFLEENSIEPFQNLAHSAQFNQAWVELFGWDDAVAWTLLTDLKRYGVVYSSREVGQERLNAMRTAKRHGLLKYDARTKGTHPNRDFNSASESSQNSD